jgi:hypothetical protein
MNPKLATALQAIAAVALLALIMFMYLKIPPSPGLTGDPRAYCAGAERPNAICDGAAKRE